jgi:hypothetical protein
MGKQVREGGWLRKLLQRPQHAKGFAGINRF